MERCRIIKNSLRKIDKEMKTNKQDNEIQVEYALRQWNKFKDDLTTSVKTEKLIYVNELLKDYFDSFHSLDFAEDDFFKKYKDLTSICKEERYLDELTENIDQEYRTFKRSYDKFRRKEFEIIKDDKSKNIDLYTENLIIKLENEYIEMVTITDEIDNDYQQLYYNVMKKIDFFIKILSLFRLEKPAENPDSKEIISGKPPKKFDPNEKSQESSAKKKIETSRTMVTEETKTERKTMEGTIGGFSNKDLASGNQLEKELIDKYLGKKTNEPNKDNEKKKIRVLSDYAIHLRKLKNELFKFILLETKLMKAVYSLKEKGKGLSEKLIKQGKQFMMTLYEFKERKEDYLRFEEYFKQPKTQQLKNAPSNNIFTEIIKITNVIDKKALTSGGFADISRLSASIYDRDFLF